MKRQIVKGVLSKMNKAATSDKALGGLAVTTAGVGAGSLAYNLSNKAKLKASAKTRRGGKPMKGTK